MGIETIGFSEERIPQVVEIILAGIKKMRADPATWPERRQTAAQLEVQCTKLTEYWNRLQAE